jgi:hypothetical protein
MPWVPIQLAPGLNVELTPTDLRGGYSSTSLGRFRAGRFQKMGGWTKYYPNLISGSPRATHAFQDLAGNDRVAIGGTTSLLDLTSGLLTDVTPQTVATTPTCSFTTTIGSPIVTIVDAGITNVTSYDAVYFRAPVSVDTIILHGVYQITTYLSAHSYSITAAKNGAAGVATGGAVPTFTATAGSANITVTFADHGLSAGDDIVFPVATTVGGISISGRYIAQSITSSSAFVITAANAAATTPGAPVAMNSGNAAFTYHIAIGPIAAGGAYGTGNYGAGAYGLGAAVSAQTGTDITATDWTLDNWGELLVSCPDGGGIYYWGPASGFSNSSLISTGPYFNTGMFISNVQQMIIAYGSTIQAKIGIYHDPLRVKWCDSEDLTMWTPASTNQAGGYRISKGSKCVGGAATPNRNLIWTDLGLWAMDYIGSSLVFSMAEIASGCGLIAKHAHTTLGGVTYWWTKSGFWTLSGDLATQLPCPVWDAVFQDLDTNNLDRCHVGANSDHTEVWFFYPSKADALGYCTRYAKVNVIEQTWDIGSMQRNTWLDRSVAGNPIATTEGGALYKHEDGYNADLAPLAPYFITSWIYVSEGQDCVFVDRIIPDLKWGEYAGLDGAVLQVTVYAVKYPGDTPKTYGPFTINKAKQYISKRFRARQVMLKIQSSDMDSFWRMGHFRVRCAADGKSR